MSLEEAELPDEVAVPWMSVTLDLSDDDDGGVAVAAAAAAADVMMMIEW